MNAYAVKRYLGKRENQEDSARVIRQSDSDPAGDLLMLLADGMGGHAGGEVASRIAIERFAAHFVSGSQSPRPRERLGEALRAANEAIAARVAAEPALKGMGCTLIGALKLGDRLVWVSVGDSILYLYRGGVLTRLNADHSLFGELRELVAAGKMAAADAESHPKRNALRSALTGGTVTLIDVDARDLEGGDLVLLASDGLDTLSETQIIDVIANSNGAKPDALAEALISAVIRVDRPGQDNTSLIIYRHSPQSVSALMRDSKWRLMTRIGPYRASSFWLGVASAAAVMTAAAAAIWYATREPEPAPPAPTAPAAAVRPEASPGRAITDAPGKIPESAPQAPVPGGTIPETTPPATPEQETPVVPSAPDQAVPLPASPGAGAGAGNPDQGAGPAPEGPQPEPVAPSRPPAARPAQPSDG